MRVKNKRVNVGNEWMMLLLMWLNRSVATINATLQLLYIDETSKNVTRWIILGDSLQSMYVMALFVDF